MNFCKTFANCYKFKRKCFSMRYFTSQAETKGLKVLFFGTDTFSLPSLQMLGKHHSNDEHLAVVTSFKSPANCVRVYAEQHKLALHKWPIKAEQCEAYDLGVVVSFGHLIPTHIIKAFPLGMINLHASLLPRWRGAAPIIYALMNGDKETGVSIMRIEPKRFDVGDIFAQKTVAIKPDILMPELHKELAETGADLLWQVISGYPQSFENTLKQCEENASYAPKVNSSLTEINWNSMTANDVYNRHRALYSFKALTSKILSKSIEFLDLSISTNAVGQIPLSDLSPGSMVYYKGRKCLIVKCAKNTLIEVHRLRLEGKKVMSAMDFNNGFLKKMKKNDMEFCYNKSAVSC